MKRKLAILLATWFGSGLIPPIFLKGMAGTYGSFFSVPLCFFAISLNNPYWYWLIIIAVFIIGLWSVPIAEKAIGPKTDWRGKIKNRDQNQIVIDETFGMLITCLPLTYLNLSIFSWTTVGLMFLAFLYFRFFDIVKIWPIKFFDNQKNAWGVMMDDGIAGFYASIILYITHTFLF